MDDIDAALESSDDQGADGFGLKVETKDEKVGGASTISDYKIEYPAVNQPESQVVIDQTVAQTNIAIIETEPAK